jgi:hypothetical protein
MHIYLPKGFDPKKEIRGYKVKYHEKYLWLIHTIIVEGSRRKKKKKGDYIPLMSSIIEDFLGPLYSVQIKEALDDSDVIDIDQFYIKGDQSRGYRINKRFADKGIDRIEFNSKKAAGYVLKQMKWNKERIKNLPDQPVYKLQYQNLLKVDLDVEAAWEYLNTKQKTMSVEQFDSRRIALDEFELKQFYFVIDPNTNRVYHSIASLPSDLRQFLSYNQNTLVNIDLSNSQPLLFCPTLKDYWQDFLRSYNKALREWKGLLIPGVTWGINGHEIRAEDVLARVKYSKKLPDDIRRYIALNEKGKFYDEFMNFLKQKGEKVPERSKFKESFFEKIFFGRIKRHRSYQYDKWFEEWMPNVFKAVMWAKKDKYQHLAYLLQRNESAAILNGVCEEFIKTNNDPFFLTIHDSIICEKTHQKAVQKIIKDVYRNLYKLKPTIKSEALTPSKG